MKLPWIIAAATGVAALAYIILNTPGPEYATGSDGVEDAARRTSQWGSKSRISALGANVSGKVKEAAGKFTGDGDVQQDGVIDQAAGAVKDTAGKVAQVAGQTIHDLNR